MTGLFIVSLTVTATYVSHYDLFSTFDATNFIASLAFITSTRCGKLF